MTAVFSRQTLLIGDSIAGSGGMMAAVTVVGVCVGTSFMSVLGASDDLRNSAPQRLE